MELTAGAMEAISDFYSELRANSFFFFLNT